MAARGIRRWLEPAFFATGLVTAGTFLALSAPALITRLHALPDSTQQALQQSADGPVVALESLSGSYREGPASADGTRLGTLTIPALHLTAPVLEGVSDADLRRGVGHVPGSAQSGGLGNVVLAAHRDTIFRPIRGIQKGMEVQLSGHDGTYRYQVDSMQVVAPDRLDILEISNQPEVTLITCYPFNFIGSAPMRFIVKAHLLSALPVPNS